MLAARVKGEALAVAFDDDADLDRAVVHTVSPSAASACGPCAVVVAEVAFRPISCPA